MENEKTRMNLTLDRRLKERLEEIADNEKRSTNAQVEVLLEMGVRKYAEAKAK
jgi:hypothetical protein